MKTKAEIKKKYESMSRRMNRRDAELLGQPEWSSKWGFIGALAWVLEIKDDT